MARQSKLTPEQWATAKRRWEGCDKIGFAWLVREVEAAWGVSVGRKSFDQEARLKGWEKGGPPSQPIEPTARNIPPAEESGPAKEKRNIPPKRNGPSVFTLVPKGKAKGVSSPGSTPPPTPPEVASEVTGPAGPPPTFTPMLKGTVGRPTKYDPAFVELILDFFNKDPVSKEDVPQPSGVVRRQLLPTNPPMLADFAKMIGVSMDTMGRWANEMGDDGQPRYPEFAEAYARAREMHESFLVRGGLLEVLEPRMVQIALKNLHGWQDQPARKTHLTAPSKEELDRRYGERMAASRARMQQVLEERQDLLGPPGAD